MVSSNLPPYYRQIYDPKEEMRRANASPIHTKWTATVHRQPFVATAATSFSASIVVSIAIINYPSGVEHCGFFLTCAICVLLKIVANVGCAEVAIVVVVVKCPLVLHKFVALIVPVLCCGFILWMIKACADQVAIHFVSFYGAPSL
ncbi:uncharacterized protein M421DRAFT_394078 [Didymella exigua CBS 183.55]|uniref:Uncharacterized protein n=1 Tax=Didymella exigua CBS 183.55 TaxID=1150837 RepID=A0A6A5RHN5_9PLEO|nr:uncharacterized protein M421DRAFT_394078 [Didymella exigua CBS 183.55]KAF1927069.1 hypothetical protein M421DRAFT_394078 [Didymella exigua CBS 183.55]